jgi:hypothetical protein
VLGKCLLCAPFWGVQICEYQWRTDRGWGVQTPPHEIPKFWQSTKN